MSLLYIEYGNRHTTLTNHIAANNEPLPSTVVLETSAIASTEGLHHWSECRGKVRLN
jgi:hypothetical protein